MRLVLALTLTPLAQAQVQTLAFFLVDCENKLASNRAYCNLDAGPLKFWQEAHGFYYYTVRQGWQNAASNAGCSIDLYDSMLNNGANYITCARFKSALAGFCSKLRSCLPSPPPRSPPHGPPLPPPPPVPPPPVPPPTDADRSTPTTDANADRSTPLSAHSTSETTNGTVDKTARILAAVAIALAGLIMALQIALCVRTKPYKVPARTGHARTQSTHACGTAGMPHTLPHDVSFFLLLMQDLATAVKTVDDKRIDVEISQQAATP